MARTDNAFHARRNVKVVDKGWRSGLQTSGSGAVVVDEGWRSGLKRQGGSRVQRRITARRRKA